MRCIKILVLLFFIQNVNGQSSYFNIKKSQKYKSQHGKTTVLSVDTNGTNHTVVARRVHNNLIFETFDENAQGKKVQIKPLMKEEFFASKLFYDNKIKIFTLYYPSTTDRIMNCHIYDVENNTYEKIELFKTAAMKKSSLFSGRNEKQSDFAVSPNGKFIAIAVNNYEKNSNSFLTHVFDTQSLKLVYSRNHHSNPEKHFKPADMIVNNQGKVYSIGREYFKGKKEEKGSKINYLFVLSELSKEEANVKRIELDEGEYIQGFKMIFKENNLNLIGFYSKRNGGAIEGVSQYKINTSDLTVSNKKKLKLPAQMYVEDRNYREFESRILEDGNGNIFLIAEELYISYSSSFGFMNGVNQNFGTTFASRGIHYGDILITKLNPDGDLIWGEGISRRSNYPSYNAFIKDDKLHVLIRSNRDLTKEREDRPKMKNPFRFALYGFVYDGDNTICEKIYDDLKKTEYLPSKGSHENGKFVMYNHPRRKKQLMIIEF